MDITILFSLLCLLFIPYARAGYPNITHSEPIHNEVTKFGHQVCEDGDVYKRPDGLLKCCVRIGGRLSCKEVECEDDDTTIIEDVKTEMEPMPRSQGRICMPHGLIFRGKNNLLYCCDGAETQRLCTRILCPKSASLYNELSYEVSESQRRISRRIKNDIHSEDDDHHRSEYLKSFELKHLQVASFPLDPPSSKHDDFFGYLQ